jgi:hypothetical protein
MAATNSSLIIFLILLLFYLTIIFNIMSCKKINPVAVKKQSLLQGMQQALKKYN